MRKLLAVTAIVGTAMVGLAGTAIAADRNDHDRDDSRNHEKAPEPLTIAGLALGATGIAGAGFWARKSRRTKR
ncbi:MAG TPA: PEP-CTERM sorting domain-containing protein [Polyangiaceae bacterium]|nr:PEP-CTERM sorting domain-containing protein [Polyangiaceae bacterium]